MKKFIIMLSICLCYISLNNVDNIYSDESKFIRLAYNESIGNLVTVRDSINWFRLQIEEVNVTTENFKDAYYVKYCFQDKGKSMGSLELQYTNEICSQVILKMIINGTQKIYYDEEARRILRMLISYNDEFEYYIQK